MKIREKSQKKRKFEHKLSINLSINMSADEIDKLYQNYEVLNSATDKTKVGVSYRF